MAISVVIPTLGRAATLHRALARLAAQEHAREHEVIVVADAAEPDVAAVRAAAAEHTVLQADVPGVSAARNAGWRAARHDVVLFLGDDILAEPGLLAAHARVHEREPDEGVAVQGTVRWADELRRTAFMEYLDQGRWQFDFPPDDAAGSDAGWGRLYACNASLKRRLLDRVGGFDESFSWGYEELELARRLADEGLVLRWTPDARAEHLHEPTLAGWCERMRRVARAEQQMVAAHPDVEPFFARRAEQLAERPGSGRGRHLVERFPRRPRVRASAHLHWDRELATAFLSAWRAPEVDPAVYDEGYYRESCAGAELWQQSGGAEIDPLYRGSLEIAGLPAGEVVVDIGTGRGELLVAAHEAGARRTIGVEYSPAAVALAQRTLAAHPAAQGAEVLLADARALPLADAMADLVTMLDVVEHLTADERAAAYAEARRILRPGGRMLVHTMPTRTLYEVTYRVQRSLTPQRLRTWPRDPRRQLERDMHVGEQTLRVLRRELRTAGFADVSVRPGAWIHDDFVPDERARRLYRRLARTRLTRSLGAADLWALARRPPARTSR
jgi:GT2 family glycosyltransferase/cyclopropane fatty-acyl-phospholipid synthase-like methyltransferase